jgi:hypothetical protein
MAGRFVKARRPYLFRLAGTAAGNTPEKYLLFGSRLGENQETSERLTQTNVAAALNGLGGHSHVRNTVPARWRWVRWPGSYTFV